MKYAWVYCIISFDKKEDLRDQICFEKCPKQ